jgi:hypothetical protein
MIPCRDCPQRYIGQTSKKSEILITEHKNAIKRYDYKSLPAQTKHAREFKEAWYSIDGNTINRHVDIPLFTYNLKQHVNVLLITTIL